MRQARYWLLTIPKENWSVPERLTGGLSYLKGQEEIGESGYEHWQLLAYFTSKVSIRAVKELFGEQSHCEASRSSAASNYVWKEASAVPDTRFELGQLPVNRNKSVDWERVWDLAVQGNLLEIPADIRTRYYGALVRIRGDFAQPSAGERDVKVFWGATGTGKSRTAWDEAGLFAYTKDPRSKFWYGYRGEEHVIIDEFRGGIDVSHMLRWLDRYPVHVETKGGSVALKATKIWITSNLNPRDWYTDLDSDTLNALLRRVSVRHFGAGIF